MILTIIPDKILLFMGNTWIAVLRFFWNIGWSKIGPSRNGDYRKFTSFGP
jgi:hypothetical protein